MSHSPQLMLDDANEAPAVEEEEVVMEEEEQSEEVVPAPVPEPVSTVVEEKPVETIPEPQVEPVVEPVVVETQETPKPQEEEPKVEEVVVEEPVIEVKESTSVSVEPQPQLPAKPSEVSDNKAPKQTKKVEGAKVSQGPLTVAQNPDNKGVYSGHELGKQ